MSGKWQPFCLSLNVLMAMMLIVLSGISIMENCLSWDFSSFCAPSLDGNTVHPISHYAAEETGDPFR